MYGEKPMQMPARPLSREDQALLDIMAADVIRRAATLDKLCEELEVAACILDMREKDLAMREDDLLKASLEMKQRRGAFSA